MSRRIVASLHGANGVVIQTVERDFERVHTEDYYRQVEGVMGDARAAWCVSIANGCRVVIGIPDDAASGIIPDD